MNPYGERMGGAGRPGFFGHVNLLRAFAALSVAVYHVVELTEWKSFPAFPHPLGWFRTGWMGVDLFFVISGFVIMLAALRAMERAADTGAARRAFFIHRLARIAPLYLLTGAVFVAFGTPELVRHPDFWKHLLTHLTFTHNWFLDTQGSIDGPNWSVAAEFQFYLLILACMPWLARVPPLALLLGGAACAWAFRAGVFLIAEREAWEVFPRFVYATQMPMMLDEFAAGMFLARLLHAHPEAVMRAGRKWGPPAFLLLMAAAQGVYWHGENSSYWHIPYMVIFWRSALGAAFAALVWWLASLPEAEFTHTLPYRAGFYLGEISYGIYLWHLMVILGLKELGFNQQGAGLALTLGLTLLAASLSWHLLEKPMIARGRRWAGKTVTKV